MVNAETEVAELKTWKATVSEEIDARVQGLARELAPCGRCGCALIRNRIGAKNGPEIVEAIIDGKKRQDVICAWCGTGARRDGWKPAPKAKPLTAAPPPEQEPPAAPATEAPSTETPQ